MNGIDPKMPESVAILGWGSTIWSPPDSLLTEHDRLKIPGCWHSDGPTIPLEFSRVAPDGRLLLVVDPAHGRACQVFYTLSGCSSVAEAMKDFQMKEGLVSAEQVHSLIKGEVSTDVVRSRIAAWLDIHNFDAAIWVGLGNNFQERTGRPFTVENALEYLESLDGETRDAALSYLMKVPESMDTMVRIKWRSTVAAGVPG
jgi:hypothetical protein